MKTQELRHTLSVHLDTLQRNLAVVSLDVLKTKYQKPFNELKINIQNTATAYVKHITLEGLRFRCDLLEEAAPIIQSAIDNSGLLKQIAHAAFHKQDINAIEHLAFELKQTIEHSLETFYNRHLCLYLTAECFAAPPKQPELFNEATGCILRDGKWVPLDSQEPAILLYVHAQPEKAA